MSINISKIEKTKIKTDYGRMNVLIYGLPKVGKTTLASRIPDALFLATEEGHNLLEVYKQNIVKWEDVYELGKQLAPTNDRRFKTLIIDIADYFYKRCQDYVCEKNGIAHPADAGYGKGFDLVKSEFIRTVTKLNMLGYGMHFISHAKTRTEKTTTSEWTMMGTSMGGSPEGVVAGMCDLIFYCYISEKGERLVRTKSTKYVLAGDRIGTLPEIMPMDYDVISETVTKCAKEKAKKKKAEQVNSKKPVDKLKDVPNLAQPMIDKAKAEARA